VSQSGHGTQGGFRHLLLMGGLGLALVGCQPFANPPFGSPGKLHVVAAENFYGDIVQQIGGTRVETVSVLNDPNADPHDFEANPRAATAVAVADLVVENGLGYDAWMDHLLSGSPSESRTLLVAGDIAGKKTGDNPHVWYDLAAMARLGRFIGSALTRLDPPSRRYFATREQRFRTSLHVLQRQIEQIRAGHAGEAVTQTEPVFLYMLRALGLRATEGAFQRAIEEGNDPSPQAVISFESLLRHRAVRVLVYNLQAVRPITQTMQGVARRYRIPIVGVTETEPTAQTYQRWMASELNHLAQALNGAP
jgi:zinc/manganese transport system substrate-binding protein